MGNDFEKIKKMTHGSLFSGIGGFDLAAEWIGWENIFHCEKNEFCQKVLSYYWPNSENFIDITKTDFKKYANKIDILTGGFPCQPYSQAGKRLGKSDDRHLWPEMLRAIREIKPDWIVAENVYGIVNWNSGLVFNEVQIDLEAEGYEVQPVLLSACSKNAPHKRERIWFIAYSSSFDEFLSIQQRRQDETKNINFDWKNEKRIIANANKDRFGNRKNKQKQINRRCGETNNSINGKNGDASYTSKIGLQRGEQQYSKRKGTFQFRRFSPTYRRDSWENFPTQSPICSGNDGISSKLDGITFPKWRKESIAAYGNAIVPQVAYEIFRIINCFEKTNVCEGKK